MYQGKQELILIIGVVRELLCVFKLIYEIDQEPENQREVNG